MTLEEKLYKIRPYIDIPGESVFSQPQNEGFWGQGETAQATPQAIPLQPDASGKPNLPKIRVFFHLQPTARGSWNAFYAAPGLPIVPKNLSTEASTPEQAIDKLQSVVDILDLLEKPTVKGEDVPKNKR